MSNQNTVFSLITAISVLVIIFIFGREFFCWYFKINEILTNIRQSNQLMNEQNKILVSIYNEITEEGNGQNKNKSHEKVKQEKELNSQEKKIKNGLEKMKKNKENND